MTRILLFCTILFALAFPGQSFAQSSAQFEKIDQRCFTKSECVEARLEYAPFVDPEEGFYPASLHADALAACGGSIINSKGDVEEAGFCLPVSQAQTTISLSGRDTFPELATYIAFLYRYSFIVASTIATLFILVAGIRWLTSGGNSEAIGSAKKRIAGAVSGLIILATSYVILNTINPALTSFRLPQVWLLRSQSLQDAQCRYLSGDRALQLARTSGAQSYLPFDQAKMSSEPVDPLEAGCGNEYYISGAPGQLCTGHSCPSLSGFETCAKYPGQNATCVEANIVGRIYTSNFLLKEYEKTNGIVAGSFLYVGRQLLDGDGWTYPWIDDDVLNLYLVCDGSQSSNYDDNLQDVSNLLISRNGLLFQTADFVEDLNDIAEQRLTIKTQPAQALRNAMIARCGSEEQALGFVLEIELDETGEGGDERHLIGNDRGAGVDLGTLEEVSGIGPAKQHALCILQSPVGRRFLIQPDDIEQGIQIDINVSNIADVDDWVAQADTFYSKFGYTYFGCLTQNQQQQFKTEERIDEIKQENTFNGTYTNPAAK